MIIVRSILALLVLAVAAIVAVYWETAIAPQWMARQALRQMEVHTDGQGDRLAAERRMATLVQHWPAELASAVGILASLGLIFGGEKLRDAGRSECLRFAPDTSRAGWNPEFPWLPSVH